MGANESCSTRMCFKKAEVTCECNNQMYCSTCLSEHIQSHAEKGHGASPLKQSTCSTVVDWKSDMILKRLLYRTPEGLTEVYEGRSKETNERYAVKIQICLDKTLLNKKLEEATLHRGIRHSHICKCISSYIDDEYTPGYKLVMIMEFASNDLSNEIEIRRRICKFWKEKRLLRHMKGLISALAYLQESNLAHRDIKPANILVFKNGSLKLADFGLSVQGCDPKQSMEYKVVGTVLYLAPKLKQAYVDMWEERNTTGTIKNNPYKSDVFSLGLTFLHMATLNSPAGLNNLQDGEENLQQQIDLAISYVEYSFRIQRVLAQMLKVREKDRKDFIQLKQWIYNELNVDMTEEYTPPNVPEEFPEEDTARIPVLKTEISKQSLILYYSAHTLNEYYEDIFDKIIRGDTITDLTWTRQMSEIEAMHLSVILPYCKELKILDINGARIGLEHFKPIATGLSQLVKLEHLSLGDNLLTTVGASLIEEVLENMPNLKILRLWNNDFEDEGIEYLSSALEKLTSLEELYLGANKITDTGMIHLSPVFPASIRVISLPDNKLGTFSIRQMSSYLPKLLNLEGLYLENNKIENASIKYFSSCLPPSLRSLRIQNNFIKSTEILQLQRSYPRLKITV
jgi:serine/threonine protein kinase